MPSAQRYPNKHPCRLAGQIRLPLRTQNQLTMR